MLSRLRAYLLESFKYHCLVEQLNIIVLLNNRSFYFLTIKSSKLPWVRIYRCPRQSCLPKSWQDYKKINYNNRNYINYWIIFVLPKIDWAVKNIKLVLSKNHTYKPKQVIEVKYQIIWNCMATTNMEDMRFVQPGQYAWDADRFPGASNLVASDS